VAPEEFEKWKLLVHHSFNAKPEPVQDDEIVSSRLGQGDPMQPVLLGLEHTDTSARSMAKSNYEKAQV
jgi:hypothetical protein